MRIIKEEFILLLFFNFENKSDKKRYYDIIIKDENIKKEKNKLNGTKSL